jgi:hypothetical protein
MSGGRDASHWRACTFDECFLLLGQWNLDLLHLIARSTSDAGGQYPGTYIYMPYVHSVVMK